MFRCSCYNALRDGGGVSGHDLLGVRITAWRVRPSALTTAIRYVMLLLGFSASLPQALALAAWFGAIGHASASNIGHSHSLSDENTRPLSRAGGLAISPAITTKASFLGAEVIGLCIRR